MNEIKNRAEQKRSLEYVDKIAINGDLYRNNNELNISNNENGLNSNLSIQDLAGMNANHFVTSYYELKSNRKLSKIFIFIKRLIRKVNKFLVEEPLKKQTLFNQYTTRYANSINDELINVNKIVNSINKNMREEIEKLSFSLEDYRIRLERIEENIRNNNKQINLVNDPNKEIHMKKSYAQAGEDCILKYIFLNLGMDLTKLTYLDIGANKPIEDNNTYLFYELGSHGVIVEANKDLILDLELQRKRDIVINKCVTAESKNKSVLYKLNVSGLSTTDNNSLKSILEQNKDVELLETVDVEAITVDEIIENYFLEIPDIISIDIEGIDFDVLRSINLSKYRPKIIIIETVQYKNGLAFNKNNQVKEYMATQMYVEYCFNGINSIFIDNDIIGNKLGNN